MPTVELSRHAVRDLQHLAAADRVQVVGAIDSLAAGLPNLNVKALAGHPGWLRLRLRSGDWRVLYRKSDGGWWVERVVNRRDLDRAVRTL